MTGRPFRLGGRGARAISLGPWSVSLAGPTRTKASRTTHLLRRRRAALLFVDSRVGAVAAGAGVAQAQSSGEGPGWCSRQLTTPPQQHHRATGPRTARSPELRTCRLVNSEPSGGKRPISITANRGVAYVLNAGTSMCSGLGEQGNITGFPSTPRASSHPSPARPGRSADFSTRAAPRSPSTRPAMS